MQADIYKKPVIMLKTEHIIKWQEDTYKKEQKYFTTKIQGMVNNLVLKWRKSGVIDTTTKNRQTCYTGHAPYIYDLPKIHKKGIPLRPSGKFSLATYNVSKSFWNIFK